MKRFTKNVPLFRILAKKDTLIYDLLRSEPHSEKSTLFWEFSDTHGITQFVKVVHTGASIPLSCAIIPLPPSLSSLSTSILAITQKRICVHYAYCSLFIEKLSSSAFQRYMTTLLWARNNYTIGKLLKSTFQWSAPLRGTQTCHCVFAPGIPALVRINRPVLCTRPNFILSNCG